MWRDYFQINDKGWTLANIDGEDTLDRIIEIGDSLMKSLFLPDELESVLAGLTRMKILFMGSLERVLQATHSKVSPTKGYFKAMTKAGHPLISASIICWTALDEQQFANRPYVCQARFYPPLVISEKSSAV